MTSQVITTPPSVSWAQRSTRVFLTINVECKKPDIKIEKNTISFKGVGEPEKKMHEVVIPLYAEVDPEKCKYINKGRLIEVVLSKEKTDQPFWPSLTNDKKKHHWLKVDFNRWQDEDESGEDLDDMFSADFDGNQNEKDESSSAEEEDMPDIE